MSTTLGNTVEEVVRGYMSKLTELSHEQPQLHRLMDFMLVKNGFEMVPTFPYDHNSFVDVVVFEQTPDDTVRKLFRLTTAEALWDYLIWAEKNPPAQARFLFVEDISREVVGLLGAYLDCNPSLFERFLPLEYGEVSRWDLGSCQNDDLPSDLYSSGCLAICFHRLVDSDHRDIHRLVRDINSAKLQRFGLPNNLKILASAGIREESFAYTWLDDRKTGVLITDSFASIPFDSEQALNPGMGYCPAASLGRHNPDDIAKAKETIRLLYGIPFPAAELDSSLRNTMLLQVLASLKVDLHAQISHLIPVIASKAVVHLWHQVVQARSRLEYRREALDVSNGIRFAEKAKENSRMRDILHRILLTLVDLKRFSSDDPPHQSGGSASPPREVNYGTTMKAGQPGLTMRHVVEDLQHVQSVLEEAIRRSDIQVMISGTAVTVSESRNAISLSKKLGYLTTLAAVFIPLSFVASIFGMNVKQFNQGSPTSLWVYFATAIPITILSLLCIQLYPLMKRWTWKFLTTISGVYNPKTPHKWWRLSEDSRLLNSPPYRWLWDWSDPQNQ